MSIPMVLVGGPLVGFLVGQFLDQKFSSEPWGVAVTVLIGLIAGFVQTVRLFQYAQREFNDPST